MKLKLISFLLLFINFSVFAATGVHHDAPAAGSLKGTVTDKADGKSIPGVTVTIPDLKTGTVTDMNGKYSLNRVPNGIYLVQFTSVGYSTVTQRVDFSKVTTLDVVMQSATIENAEVIITGVTRATELKRSPIPMAAVGKLYLDQRAASGNVIDQIATLPGVSAVTTGPNVSKPFIHGLGYNRVLTMQDGIRQEGQQWGDEHGIEVDQNSIDRIEVIKGPASLTYGSDAVGGVVNLISPPPVADGAVLGSVQGTYGTNQGLYNGSFRLQGNHNGLVWSTILSAKNAKDYQNQHDGRVFATNYKERDARVMLGLTKSWGYSYFNASLYDDQQAIPDGSRDSVSRRFTKQITEDDASRPIVPESELNSYNIPLLHQHVQLYRIYNNSNFELGGGNLVVNLGYQFSHRREYTHPEAADIPGLNLHLQTYTYDVKYNFNIGNDYETTFGINGQYQNNSIGGATDFPIPAYHQFDIGPFFVVKKSFDRLDLSAGARYDTRSFTGDAAYIDTTNATFPKLYTGSNAAASPNVVKQFDALNKTFSGFSGSFGATYNFSKAFLLKANIARGFRAPSIAELSANGPDPGSQIYHVGNANFKPEFSLQEDFGAFLTLPVISATVEVFNNNISNYIFQQQVLDNTGAPVINQGYNEFTYVQSKARLHGGEIGADIHPLPWLHFENAVSVTYGENLGTGGKVADSLKYLPFIPPLHSHSELKVNFNKSFSRQVKNVYAFIGFDHYSAQNRFFSAYGTETATPGYNLLSAGFGGDLVNKAGVPIVKLFIEGTNLANVNYQSNMSRLKYFDNDNPGPGVRPGIFNMGRNISFKVVVPFDLSHRDKKSS